MEIIGLLFLGLILFILLGIGGWIIQIFGTILEWLFDGCLGSIGCLFWFVIILFLLIGMCV